MNQNNNSIIKSIRKEKPYTQILNEILENKTISRKAQGILCYILSKPTDWHVYISDLQTEKDGEKAIRSGIKELIEAKYMQRYRVFDKETGKVHHWETLTSETPFDDSELISSVKEEYLRDENGNIRYQKIKIGNFERSLPIVMNREILLLSPFVQIENLQIENEGQLINNNTNNKIYTNNESINLPKITYKDNSKKEEDRIDKIDEQKEKVKELVEKLKEEGITGYTDIELIKMLKQARWNENIVLEAYKNMIEFSLDKLTDDDYKIQNSFSYLLKTIKNLSDDIGDYI